MKSCLIGLLFVNLNYEWNLKSTDQEMAKAIKIKKEYYEEKKQRKEP
jgi:hypothetical protein